MRALIVGVTLGLIIIALIVAKQWSAARRNGRVPVPESLATRPRKTNRQQPPAAPSTDKKAGAGEPGAWVTTKDIVVKDGAFTDPKHRIRGTVPKGWYLRGAQRKDETELSLQFASPTRPGSVLTAYFSFFGTMTTWEQDERRNPIEFKTAQRKREGYENYVVSPDIVMRSVSGKRLVAWRASFTRDNANWTECITRVEADRYTMLFFFRAQDAEAENVLPAFKTLAENTSIE